MELKEVIAKNICSLRTDAGLTQLQLASILNYSDKAISKWERAESVPDVFMLKRIADYFPFLMTDKNGISPKRNYLTRSRFLFWPSIFLIATLIPAILLSLRFTDFTRFIFFLTFIACLLIFCKAYLGLFEYYKGTIKLGDNIFCRRNRGFRTCEIYCPKEKVGEIVITRFPTDLFYKTCKVKVSVRSERADSLRIRNIDYETAKKQIYNCFNIE